MVALLFHTYGQPSTAVLCSRLGSKPHAGSARPRQDMRAGFDAHFHALIPRTNPQLNALTGKSHLYAISALSSRRRWFQRKQQRGGKSLKPPGIYKGLRFSKSTRLRFYAQQCHNFPKSVSKNRSFALSILLFFIIFCLYAIIYIDFIYVFCNLRKNKHKLLTLFSFRYIIQLK